MPTLYLDGVESESLGLVPLRMAGWAGLPQFEFETVALPMVFGTRVVGASSNVAPRVFGFRMRVAADDLEARRTTLASVFARLGNRRIAVATVEDPTKVCYGLLSEAPVTTPFKELLTPGVYADLQIVCHDPRWYDTAPIVTAVKAGTRGTLEMGGAPTEKLRLLVVGPATTPVVILRDHTGAEVQRMTFLSLAADEYLDIDHETYTIDRYDSGIRTDGLPLLNADEDLFHVVEGGPYTVECAQGDLIVYHHRAYWS